MSDKRLSRELADRVEIEFHRRPRRFRRLVWRTALAAGVVSLGWLAWSAVRGEQRLYEAGPLATPHQFIENDCAQCHTTWGPLQRLVRFDGAVRSVDNHKCELCHAGPPHHANQTPAHDSFSCADCHREHQGDRDLKRVANRLCVACHRDLRTSDGQPASFVDRIERFDALLEDGGHPPFAIERLLTDGDASTEETRIGPKHDVFSVLAFFQRENEQAERWHDRAQIQFNHAVHLKHEYQDGELVVGLRDEHGTLVDLSKNCQTCHEPDSDGRVMRPINYENHCRRCHPLHFDVDKQDKTVPHERAEVVRGFLTEIYTLQALALGDAGDGGADDDNERPSNVRTLPGRSVRSPLTHTQAEQVKEQVARGEEQALSHIHLLFNRPGGCRYCHTVTDPPESTTWEIVSPNIPQRWLKHSRFRHDRHRMLDCAVCHTNLRDGTAVAESRGTGDVLLPSLNVCLKCHTSTPATTNADKIAPHFGGARTDCIECHTYHDHSSKTPLGRHTPETLLRSK